MSDRWTIEEVAHPRTYQRWLNVGRDDVVLDIGMNIGAFAVFYGSKAKRCVGYEPERGNYDLAVINIKQNKMYGEVITRQRAVMGSDVASVKLYINSGSRRDGDTIIPKQGRRAEVVKVDNINDIISEFSPNKIKMDCEGSEYDIIKNVKDWSGIESMVFEWHRVMIKDESNTKLAEILSIIDANFTEVHANRSPAGWMQIIRCKK
jgi:FkbM family methyltransferase